MKVFLSATPEGEVRIQARAESEDGRTLGDLTQEVGPGEGFAGHTFEELKALGDGGHDLEPKG